MLAFVAPCAGAPGAVLARALCPLSPTVSTVSVSLRASARKRSDSSGRPESITERDDAVQDGHPRIRVLVPGLRPLLLLLAYSVAIVACTTASTVGAIVSMLAFGIMGFIAGSARNDWARNQASLAPSTQQASSQQDQEALDELRNRVAELEASSLSSMSSSHGSSHQQPATRAKTTQQQRGSASQPRSDYHRWLHSDPALRRDSPHSSTRMRERLLFCFGEQGLRFFGLTEDMYAAQLARSADTEQFLLRNKRFLEDTLTVDVSPESERLDPDHGI